MQGLRKEILELTYACGYEHPSQFSGHDIEISSGINSYDSLSKVLNYDKVSVPLIEN